MAMDRQGTGLAIIRIFVGLFFLFQGLGKIRWFVNPSILAAQLAGWHQAVASGSLSARKAWPGRPRARSQSASRGRFRGSPEIRLAVRSSVIASAHSPAWYAATPTASRTAATREARLRAARACSSARRGSVSTASPAATRCPATASAFGLLKVRSSARTDLSSRLISMCSGTGGSGERGARSRGS